MTTSKPGFFARHILRRTAPETPAQKPLELASYLAHIEPFIQAYTETMKALPRNFGVSTVDTRGWDVKFYTPQAFTELVTDWVIQWGQYTIGPLRTQTSKVEALLDNLEKGIARLDEEIARAPAADLPSLEKLRNDEIETATGIIASNITEAKATLARLSVFLNKRVLASYGEDSPISTKKSLRSSLMESLEGTVKTRYASALKYASLTGETPEQIQNHIAFRKALDTAVEPRERLLAALQVVLDKIDARLDRVSAEAEQLKQNIAQTPGYQAQTLGPGVTA